MLGHTVATVTLMHSTGSGVRAAAGRRASGSHTSISTMRRDATAARRCANGDTWENVARDKMRLLTVVSHKCDTSLIIIPNEHILVMWPFHHSCYSLWVYIWGHHIFWNRTLANNSISIIRVICHQKYTIKFILERVFNNMLLVVYN
jgi:hypothetical protein